MPYPMPLISAGLPSYTNDDFGGSFLASYGNDEVYGGSHAWRCATTPVGNANDGPLTQTVWWVVDLSSVPVSQRQQIIFYWQNDARTGAYAPDLISNFPNNLLKDYTVQISTGPGGGSPPPYPSAWTTVATVTGNTLHSKQHLVNMAGANWIGVYITAIHGSASNNNAQGKFKVFDAHVSVSDSWKLFGDSITSGAFGEDESVGYGLILPRQINAHFAGFYPLWEPAAIGGWTAQDIQPYFSAWLADFPGKYVCLNFGTNDGNLGGAYFTNYQSNMQTMITAALAAGKTVVIPTIPWLNTSSAAQTRVSALNTLITGTLIPNNSGCIAGPDLYNFFFTHQSEISSDGLHPSDPQGWTDYKIQWTNWAIANIYHNVLLTPAQTKFKPRMALVTPTHTQYFVRMALKTPTRTKYKVQLSGVGPTPYTVTNVTSVISPIRPNSTVTSTATVAKQNNATQDGLFCSVVVTYPDNSTSTPTVYAIADGSGRYYATYQTKGAGTVEELWTFTDSQGSQTQYQHPVVCSY